MESVIFSSPYLLVAYGIALFFCIFDIVRRSSRYVFLLLSAVICIGTSIAAFLMGAGYTEIGIVMLVFLALNLISFIRHKGDKK